MTIYAIDPGSTESAGVKLDATGTILSHGRRQNRAMLAHLRAMCPEPDDILVIEEAVSYGMVAGRSMFQTSMWAGRFAQRWADMTDREAVWISRPDVKLAICGSRAAKDRDIREELVHRFGAVGTKKAPGALYGVARDEWAALALGLAYLERTRDALLAKIDSTAKMSTFPLDNG